VDIDGGGQGVECRLCRFGHGDNILRPVEEGEREGLRGRYDDRDDDRVVKEKDGRSETVFVRETSLWLLCRYKN
jgi:hypothetical protein